MGGFVNQHSFLLIAVFLLAIAAFAVRRRRVATKLLLIGGVVAATAIAWAVLRTGAGAQRGELQAALRAGRPVVLEVYSDY